MLDIFMERARFATNKDDLVNLVLPNIIVQPNVRWKERRNNHLTKVGKEDEKIDEEIEIEENTCTTEECKPLINKESQSEFYQ